MQIVDIVLLVLLAIFAIQGFRKGFIAEMSSLVALVIGVYIAFFYADVTADFLSTFFGMTTKYLGMISFVLTLVLVMIAILAFGKILEKLLDMFLLGPFNSIVGAVFGLLKGVVILSLLIMMFNYFHFTEMILSKEKQEKSKIYTEIEDVAPYLLNHFGLEEKLKQYNPFKNDEKEEEDTDTALPSV
ncbi:MAG: CvpA family protein [Ignavibacteria bacterium]|nr:CvpA family protein [Ignavibacteria bacterium]